MASKEWLPWKKLIGFGLSQLHMSSEELWATTPRELDAAIDACLGFQSSDVKPTRAEMERLMSVYPD
jgi:uncharacterized phage protein (TIGR02216 family)